MAQIKVRQLQDNFGNSFYPLTVTDSIVTEKDISYDDSVTYKAGEIIPAKIKLSDLLIKVISGLRKELDELGEKTKSKEKIIEFIKEEISKLNYTDQEVSGEFIYKIIESKGIITPYRKRLTGTDLPDISIDKLVSGDIHKTIPSTLLPSYVDDVIEVNTFNELPNPGETGKIYVTKDTNLTYRWSGTQYVEISKSLALGETSDTAYAGDKGKKVTDDLVSEISRSTEKDTDLQNQINDIIGGGSGSIKEQISRAINDLNSSKEVTETNKYITKIVQTNGKISDIESKSIPIVISFSENLSDEKIPSEKLVSSELNKKQNNLTQPQLSACDSGITSENVSEGILYNKGGNRTLDTSYLSDKDIGSVTISGTWTYTKDDGSNPQTNTSSNLILENGYKVSWNGKWKWSTPNDRKDATSCDGSFGTEFPKKDTFIDVSKGIVTTNTSYIQHIYAPKLGMMVSGTRIISATGNYDQSSSISVSFRSRYYFGYSITKEIDSNIIKNLSKTNLTTTRILTDNVITETNQYVVYSYPEILGNLTKITMDGATPVFGAFTKLNNINIVNEAGITISYNVYISNNPGAFSKTASLKFE